LTFGGLAGCSGRFENLTELSAEAARAKGQSQQLSAEVVPVRGQSQQPSAEAAPVKDQLQKALQYCFQLHH
jgi:hypothetical protein